MVKHSPFPLVLAVVVLLTLVVGLFGFLFLDDIAHHGPSNDRSHPIEEAVEEDGPNEPDEAEPPQETALALHGPTILYHPRPGVVVDVKVYGHFPLLNRAIREFQRDSERMLFLLVLWHSYRDTRLLLRRRSDSTGETSEAYIPSWHQITFSQIPITDPRLALSILMPILFPVFAKTSEDMYPFVVVGNSPEAVVRIHHPDRAPELTQYYGLFWKHVTDNLSVSLWYLNEWINTDVMEPLRLKFMRHACVSCCRLGRAYSFYRTFAHLTESTMGSLYDHIFKHTTPCVPTHVRGVPVPRGLYFTRGRRPQTYSFDGTYWNPKGQPIDAFVEVSFLPVVPENADTTEIMLWIMATWHKNMHTRILLRNSNQGTDLSIPTWFELLDFRDLPTVSRAMDVLFPRCRQTASQWHPYIQTPDGGRWKGDMSHYPPRATELYRDVWDVVRKNMGRSLIQAKRVLDALPKADKQYKQTLHHVYTSCCWFDCRDLAMQRIGRNHLQPLVDHLPHLKCVSYPPPPKLDS